MKVFRPNPDDPIAVPVQHEVKVSYQKTQVLFSYEDVVIEVAWNGHQFEADQYEGIREGNYFAFKTCLDCAVKSFDQLYKYLEELPPPRKFKDDNRLYPELQLRQYRDSLDNSEAVDHFNTFFQLP